MPAPLSSDTLRHSLGVDRTIRENSKDNSNRFEIHYRWNGNDMLQWCRDILKDVIFSPPLNVQLLCLWSRKYNNLEPNLTEIQLQILTHISSIFLHLMINWTSLLMKWFNQKSMLVGIFKNFYDMRHTRYMSDCCWLFAVWSQYIFFR